MAYRAVILCTIKDLYGCWWDVRETRPTTHGFDLHLGWPQSLDGTPTRGKGAGGPRLIPTRSLYRYWRGCRMSRNCIYDLPISRSAAKRVRLALRLNTYQDHRRWWQQRSADLQHLTLEQFVQRHGRHPSQASVERQRCR